MKSRKTSVIAVVLLSFLPVRSYAFECPFGTVLVSKGNLGELVGSRLSAGWEREYLYECGEGDRRNGITLFKCGNHVYQENYGGIELLSSGGNSVFVQFDGVSRPDAPMGVKDNYTTSFDPSTGKIIDVFQSTSYYSNPQVTSKTFTIFSEETRQRYCKKVQF